jgi:hypothetical protein
VPPNRGRTGGREDGVAESRKTGIYYHHKVLALKIMAAVAMYSNTIHSAFQTKPKQAKFASKVCHGRYCLAAKKQF